VSGYTCAAVPARYNAVQAYRMSIGEYLRDQQAGCESVTLKSRQYTVIECEDEACSSMPANIPDKTQIRRI
jgi:hypothetical protein